MLSLNAYEMGLLAGLIMKDPELMLGGLKGVFEQLVTIKRQIERECGVTTEFLPNGQLKMIDADGNVIIREPFPYEMEIDRWDVEAWAARSRKGEVCGIFGCPNKPTVKCKHCFNMYCEEHKFVLDTPGHPKD